MSIAAGSLNRRGRIEAPPTAVDALNQPLDDPWSVVWQGWGSLRAANGTDLVTRGSQIDADVGHYSWRMRYRPAIKAGMRLVLASGVTLAIKDVSHDHGRREWTDLACEEMPNG